MRCRVNDVGLRGGSRGTTADSDGAGSTASGAAYGRRGRSTIYGLSADATALHHICIYGIGIINCSFCLHGGCDGAENCKLRDWLAQVSPRGRPKGLALTLLGNGGGRNGGPDGARDSVSGLRVCRGNGSDGGSSCQGSFVVCNGRHGWVSDMYLIYVPDWR